MERRGHAGLGGRCRAARAGPDGRGSHYLNYQDQPLSEAHRYRALLDAVNGVFYPVNDAPQVSLNLPAGASEGTPVELRCTVRDDGRLEEVTCSWTITQGHLLIASGTGLNIMFTPADDGDYLVTVTARDAAGAESTVSGMLHVSNEAPRDLAISGPVSGLPGQRLSFSASFNDPGSADTHTIIWRITDAAGATVLEVSGSSCTFVPLRAGTYMVSCTVSDEDGGLATVSQMLQVLGAVLQADPRKPGTMMLMIYATPDQDEIVLRSTSRKGEIQVLLNGQDLGTFQPTGRILLSGLAQEDRVQADPWLWSRMWVSTSAGQEHWVGGGLDAFWHMWGKMSNSLPALPLRR